MSVCEEPGTRPWPCVVAGGGGLAVLVAVVPGSPSCSCADVPVVLHVLRKQASQRASAACLKQPVLPKPQQSGVWEEEATDGLEHARVEHRRSPVMPKLLGLPGKAACVVTAVIDWLFYITHDSRCLSLS